MAALTLIGEYGGWPGVPGIAPMCLLMAYPSPAAAACAIALLDAALYVAAVCSGRDEGGLEFVRQVLRGRMVQLMRWSPVLARLVREARAAPSLRLPLEDGAV